MMVPAFYIAGMDVDSGYTNLAMGYLKAAEDLNLNFQPTALSDY